MGANPDPLEDRERQKSRGRLTPTDKLSGQNGRRQPTKAYDERKGVVIAIEEIEELLVSKRHDVTDACRKLHPDRVLRRDW